MQLSSITWKQTCDALEPEKAEVQYTLLHILGLQNKETEDQAAGRMEVNEVEKETRMSQSSEQREGARQGICRLLFQQAGEVALRNNILPLCQNE